MTVVGIDVAKASLAVALRTPTGTVRQKRCPNTPAGHADLLRWLGQRADGAVHVGLEATGGYQDAVSLALHDAGHTVSVLNPAALEAYSRSRKLPRQADSSHGDRTVVGLGRNVRGGTRPRLSCGRSWL